MLALGKTYKDSVTGFRGIATSEHIYLNGCIRYTLTPAAIDNKVELGSTFDIQQLEEQKNDLILQPEILAKTDISLGDICLDTITNYKGTVVSRHTYLSGMVDFGLQAVMGKDGKIPEAFSFSSTSLKVVKKKIQEVKDSIQPGGPRDIPRSRNLV